MNITIKDDISINCWYYFIVNLFYSNLDIFILNIKHQLKVNFLNKLQNTSIFYKGGICMPLLLIIDDELNTRTLMEKVLKREGFDTLSAANADIALSLLEKNNIDLIIMDIMMPGMNGFDLTSEIRTFNKDIPIIMVTAKETINDKRLGFFKGADDYLVKPVDYDELSLRIYALLRRAKISISKKIIIKNTIINQEDLTITYNQKSIELPKKEFLLLFHLLSYKGKIFTRQQLMDNVWSMSSESDEHTVDVHINRLRTKLKDNEDLEIVTVRGLGYKAVEK